MAKRQAHPSQPAEKAKSKQEASILEDEEALHEGEDEAGISQQGLDRLMRALGPDDLSEMDRAMLRQMSLQGNDEESDEGNEDDEDLIDDEAEEVDGEDDDDEDDEDDDDLIDDEAEKVDGEDDNDEEDDDDEEDNADERDEREDMTSTRASAPKDSLAASILRSGLVPQEEDDEEEEEEDEEEED